MPGSLVNSGSTRAKRGLHPLFYALLVAKGRAVSAWKDEARGAREANSPTPPQPHPFDALQKCEPLLERVRQFCCERQIAERAAFDLEADGDNHPARLAHQPIESQKRPLMVSAAGKKEGARQCFLPESLLPSWLASPQYPYCAECLTESIVTEGNSWDELRANACEAVRG